MSTGEKILSPRGEEFLVAEESEDRVLTTGVPFVIVDMREKRLSVKEGDVFIYSNLEGDIPAGNTSGFGMYSCDTRFLSHFELKVNGRPPVLLSSSADQDFVAHIELTNVDCWEGERLCIPQETLNVRRVRAVKDGVHERISIRNYNPFAVSVDLELSFNGDFADMFEVRGHPANRKGRRLVPRLEGKRLSLAYAGADEVFRETRIEFSRVPDDVRFDFDRTIISYDALIEPNERWGLEVTIEPIIGEVEGVAQDFSAAAAELKLSYDEWDSECCRITTDNPLFDSVLERGRLDLRTLLNRSEHGRAFDAGIPWYVALFGRDSLITGVQSLMLNPGPARDTLRLLAAHQGQVFDEWRDEEPGKILHEVRRGELATLAEIPHTPYYGSIDSTLLFVIALGDYYRWTADDDTLRSLAGSLTAALDWIDAFGDSDRDLFVEYARRSTKGLINQGWKDSHNSVVHSDGTQAEAPIALAEVQGYAYHARMNGAELLDHLGRHDEARTQRSKAATLKTRFNEVFWMEEKSCFALALDGGKRRVDTLTSNPGHCLWSGIVDDDKAARLVETLLSPDLFSGWGIRTMARSETAYNPMSYHNGSIWPHDNSLIAAGMRRYGMPEGVEKIAKGLFDAAVHHTYFRLPELFCGFTRRGNSRPVGYPVACSPQAWAAGSFFLIFQSMLGLEPDAPNNSLRIRSPHLPSWVEHVHLSGLRVGTSRVDLDFNRHEGSTSFAVLRKDGPLKIIIEE